MKIAQSPEDMPQLADIADVSGLEFMEMMLAGKVALLPMMTLMNFTFHKVALGEVSLRATPAFAHSNQFSGTHGGWYGTILDTCMACAIMTHLPRGKIYTTLEYKINMTRGIPFGTQVVATGFADHVGRRTGVAHGEIRGVDDGKLYATGSTSCLVMSLPQ